MLEFGIPLKMAEYRHQQVSKVAYHLGFHIPAAKDQPIPATLKLQLDIHDLSHPLYLDFNAPDSLLISLDVNHTPQIINHRQEHLIIAPQALTIGTNNISIEFFAGEQSLNRNEEFLYTLLVPDRASTLFPCLDQPNIKATYELQLTVPHDWQALTAALLEKQESVNGETVYQFTKSDLMSTYLFSFVAGKFQVKSELQKDRPITFLYRETDSTKIGMSIPQIFDLHRQSIEYLEDYTAFPFPFQKLDLAAIPGFQYGGMEHVGAIQYRESPLFLDHSATEIQQLSRAKVIAHETAHMWFGDMVTMDWFNDVWMKEVFANFMADKIINPAFPQIDHSLNFFRSHYPAAYAEDRTQGTNPIRQPLNNLKNAGSLYGNIIYHKAPIMMRQLETVVGAEAFRKGIRAYMSTYAYGNATWPDLVNLLDQETSIDLNNWTDIWVNQSGRPVLKAQVVYAAGNIQQLTISQHAEDGSAKLWPQAFQIALVYEDHVDHIPVAIENQEVQITAAIGKPKPKAILYNSDGFGYGIFPIDTTSVAQIPYLEAAVTRAAAYVNLYENTLSGLVKPLTALKYYAEALPHEHNELIVSLISSEMSTLFWKYLTPTERHSEQQNLEALFYEQLHETHSPNHKKILFGLYSSIAYSKTGQNALYDLWSKKTSVKDLRLNEDDFTKLAMTLALYGHEQSEDLLNKAQTVISNPDKLERFQFLRPALSSSPEVRKAFFESFQNAENREKESWVLSACHYLHHPLRQTTAQNHLALSLQLLEEIQLTGDIFFPKRWLNATIGRYQSQAAMDLVEQFLEEHPQYNPVLKSKLLQATDDLWRFRQQQEKASI